MVDRLRDRMRRQGERLARKELVLGRPWDRFRRNERVVFVGELHRVDRVERDGKGTAVAILLESLERVGPSRWAAIPPHHHHLIEPYRPG